MSIDIFQSRSGYNVLCRWWSRNESDDYESDELVMNRIPSGQFFAKEMNAEQLMKINLGGSFRIDATHITIKSPDNLIGIKTDDLIEYEDEIWRITNVQKIKAKKQNSFFMADKNCSHFWYIELRK
ncbi:MAG: hypothetical protein K5765_06795 [Clostridia bacterium]|nr:hypothetical protein [Clostridia bacterium]